MKNSALYPNWLQKPTIHPEIYDFYDEDKTNYEIDKENMNEFCNFTADHKPENAKQKNKMRQNLVKLLWKEECAGRNKKFNFPAVKPSAYVYFRRIKKRKMAKRNNPKL